jgi:hypothetical protein
LAVRLEPCLCERCAPWEEHGAHGAGSDEDSRLVNNK